MSAILTFLKQKDKQDHIVYLYAICFTLGYLLTPILGLLLAVIVASAVAMALGLAKEAYDKRHPDKHTADPLDLLADAIGVAAAALVLLAPLIYNHF